MADNTQKQLDYFVTEKLIVPVLKDIFCDLSGVQNNNAESPLIERQGVMYRLLERQRREEDIVAFDRNYFYRRFQTGVCTEYSGDKEFKNSFRDHFIDTYRQQRELTGKTEAIAEYSPTENGEFTAEKISRVNYFVYQILKQLENDKIRSLINEKKDSGAINEEEKNDQLKDLDHGRMRLVYDQNGNLKYVSEKELKQSKEKYRPYIAVGLRDELLKDKGQQTSTATATANKIASSSEKNSVNTSVDAKVLLTDMTSDRAFSLECTLQTDRNRLKLNNPLQNVNGLFQGAVKTPDGYLLNVFILPQTDNINDYNRQFTFSFPIGQRPENCPQEFHRNELNLPDIRSFGTVATARHELSPSDIKRFVPLNINQFPNEKPNLSTPSFLQNQNNQTQALNPVNYPIPQRTTITNQQVSTPIVNRTILANIKNPMQAKREMQERRRMMQQASSGKVQQNRMSAQNNTEESDESEEPQPNKKWSFAKKAAVCSIIGGGTFLGGLGWQMCSIAVDNSDKVDKSLSFIITNLSRLC